MVQVDDIIIENQFKRKKGITKILSRLFEIGT